MSRINQKRVAVLLLAIGFSYLLATAIRNNAHGAIRATDFGAVYYGARCALEHKDPYDPQTILREFSADGGWFSEPSPTAEHTARAIVTVLIYPPSALLVVAPLAMLPWPVAQILWLGLMGILLVIAAYLVWDLGAPAPLIAGTLASFVLLNCFVTLLCANPAGVAVPLCILAVWCFLKDRFTTVAVLALALSLVIKPHDAGFLWLYLLLAGGTQRKRALQTMAVAAVLGVCAAIWITPISPHWIVELQSNLAALSSPGGPADPGPSGPAFRTFARVVNLQAALSILKNDPRFYNPVAYLIGGSFILAWAAAVALKRSAHDGALLALAAISAFSMLPVYHWFLDAKLLLMMIPACAMLWAGKGARRWIALGLTTASIFFTSDIPLILVARFTAGFDGSSSTLSGKLLLLLARPAPLVLLGTGCFYFWEYVRYQPSQTWFAQKDDAGMRRDRMTAA